MPKKCNPVNVEEARRLLDYDPTTGLFKWKVNRGNRRKAGDPACTTITPDGYYICRVNHVLYKAHRLAWAIHYGDTLEHGEIDHINCDKLDNRIENLRLLPPGLNNRNVGKKSFNTSGYNGVSWHKKAKKWAATVTYNSKYIHLGLFENKKEAAKAAKEARDKYHGSLANHT